MKILAMYLPQFHRVKENDEWWGEGFTEWSAVKSAEQIYENHKQPRIPLNKNYYNLLDKKTMEWQADLMHQYGIDGMCIYHYWFKDGRRILEKPAENLLEWKDINMPFCFCWANETWARSWSKISGVNSWADKFEKKIDENGNAILLEQKYGDIHDWKIHFNYLLSFFKDDRYIKIDNKPIVVIYKAASIGCLEEMLEAWELWAKENGFKGLHIIGAAVDYKSKKSVNEILYLPPRSSITKLENKITRDNALLKLSYTDIWDEILEKPKLEENSIFAGIVGFDNTPRNGLGGLVIEGQTPELFKKYLTRLLAKNEASGSSYTFINAWNEWGEGMYLEPDEEYGYAYLEAVLYAKKHYKEYISKYEKQIQDSDKTLLKEYRFLSKKCARYESYWRILDTWLRHKEEGISLEKYFTEKKIHSIAIYGGGMLGKHLLEELRDSNIEIAYVLDRKADALHLGIPVYSPEDEVPSVDSIVVAVTYDYVKIKEQLQKKGYDNVISLENIMMEI